MKPLYEIAKDYRFLNDMLDNIDDDSADDSIVMMLEQINAEFNEKIVAIASVLKNIDHRIDGLADIVKNIQAKILSAKTKRSCLERYVIDNMQALNIKKIAGELLDVSVRLNPESVDIISEQDIPADFFVEKTVKTVDKRKIKEAINAGELVSGACIKRTTSLNIK